MSMFYLLPPRATLGDHLSDGLGRVFPGLDWPVAARRRLADAVVAALPLDADTYLVFRDELPPTAGVEEALMDGFGAVPGDEVTEVRPGSPAKRWRIGLSVSEGPRGSARPRTTSSVG